MLGIPSYYDQYFALNPGLVDEVRVELSRTNDVRKFQGKMNSGNYYWQTEMQFMNNFELINLLIENGFLTPSKRVDLRASN